jgi:hypothetical protein
VLFVSVSQGSFTNFPLTSSLLITPLRVLNSHIYQLGGTKIRRYGDSPSPVPDETMTELNPRDRDTADADERTTGQEPRERVKQIMEEIAADRKAMQEERSTLKQERESRGRAFEEEKTRLQKITEGALATVEQGASQKDARSSGSSSTQSAYSTDFENLSSDELEKRCKSAYILLVGPLAILIES